MSTGAMLGYRARLDLVRGPSRLEGLPAEFEAGIATGAAGDGAALADLSDALHSEGRRLLVELALRDRDAASAVAAIDALRNAGVEVDVWAVTVDDAEALERVADAVRAGGRDGVGWVLVTGGDGGDGELPAAAASVPGFLGVLRDTASPVF